MASACNAQLPEPALSAHRSATCKASGGAAHLCAFPAIRPKELRELLTEYGIGTRAQSTLVDIARPADADHYGQDYDDVLPGTMREFLVLEKCASEILVHAPHQVPYLLQTPDYARAIADLAVPAADAADGLASLTLTRQQAILEERRTMLVVVIGEAALHRAVGGPETMRTQLRHLVGLSENSPRIKIQVLPVAGAGHGAGAGGPMTILRFDDVPGLGMAHLAGLRNAGVCLVDPVGLACYFRAFTQLSVAALTPSQSSRVLREMAAG